MRTSLQISINLTSRWHKYLGKFFNTAVYYAYHVGPVSLHNWTCYRGGKEVMDEPQMKYVQLTQGADYFLEHMVVLFLHVGKHRFESFSVALTASFFSTTTIS